MNKEQEVVSILMAKVRGGARIPEKRGEDAGLDLYPCFDEPYIKIKAGKSAKIPLGIMSVIPKNKCAVLKGRSSNGLKDVLITAGVIDSGYRGEWHAFIKNTSDEGVDLIIGKQSSELYKELSNYSDASKYIVLPYDKAIVQALIMDNYDVNIVESDVDRLMEYKSDRGIGKEGSSGK